jgi:phenylacetyl-CoA:acceptor oxidoreductase subunit 1
VCPTGATCQRDGGIVEINHDLCLGCGYCIVACPYDARTITSGDRITTDNETKDSIKHNPDRVGICVKCDFCLQRLREGLKKGLIPGTDAEATPLCVNFCLANAIHFGDLDDPESEVSKLIRGNTTIRLQKETASDPAVYYIVNQKNEIFCRK